LKTKTKAKNFQVSIHMKRKIFIDIYFIEINYNLNPNFCHSFSLNFKFLSRVFSGLAMKILMQQKKKRTYTTDITMRKYK
jgi:hypothetical protein